MENASKPTILNLFQTTSPQYLNAEKSGFGDNLALMFSVCIMKFASYPPLFKETLELPGSGAGILTPIPAQQVTSSLGGTAFIHGLFFAHEAEISSLVPPPGDDDALYWTSSKDQNPSEQKWERY